MPRPPARPSKPKTNGKARVAAPSAPRFLTIALELREIVYKHVLKDAPSSLTDLMVVNRQLSREVLPFQFKRHLAFDGQAELFDWFDQVGQKYLHHVVNVSFKLHDIDPEKIVGALGKRLRQVNIADAKRSAMGDQSKGNPYHEACDMEMMKIGEAFRHIPNLRQFTIATTEVGDPKPPPRMLYTFAKMLAHRFAHLHTLICDEDSMPVDYVANKPRLRRLQFPAISTSTNAEVHQHFSNLRLTDLEVYRFAHHDPSAPNRRILPQVLRSLPPLQSLLLRDESEEEPDLIYEIFIHAKDPFAKHKASLRKLTFPSEVFEAADEDEDEEWVSESRMALRNFLRDESRLKRPPGLQSADWQVWVRP